MCVSFSKNIIQNKKQNGMEENKNNKYTYAHMHIGTYIAFGENRVTIIEIHQYYLT